METFDVVSVYTTKLYTYKVFDHRTLKTYEKVKFKTLTKKCFNDYYYMFYNNNKKVFHITLRIIYVQR